MRSLLIGSCPVVQDGCSFGDKQSLGWDTLVLQAPACFLSLSLISKLRKAVAAGTAHAVMCDVQCCSGEEMAAGSRPDNGSDLT